MAAKGSECLIPLLLERHLHSPSCLFGHRSRLEVDWGVFEPQNHLLAGLFGQFADLHTLQHGGCRIGRIPEPAGTLQHRAEALSRNNPVGAGMVYLSIDRHSGPNVLPAG